VQAILSTRTFGRALRIVAETTSTNALASALAQAGASHGTVVVAETQSGGRGRLGRRWHSPPGQNLYSSIIVRPPPPADQPALWLSWIPLLSASAAARAIQVVGGLRPSVKWPNDILLGSRKLGGILCESAGIGTPQGAVVVGIGLNVNIRSQQFPDELRETATSMAIEAGRPFDRAAVLAALLSELEIRCDALFSGDRAGLRDEYKVRCSTLGRPIRVTLADGKSLEGRAVDIDDDGSLRIIPASSLDAPPTEHVSLRAGDVTHVREPRNDPHVAGR
jgi:BirA family biotin operon repressor/biotin-[acetyl-CoA-carboxylase] ligase